MNIQEQFGAIDVYWFDQWLRGRIPAGARILDAGCGRGRNVVYPLRAGCDVFAVDLNPSHVAATRALAADLRPELDGSQFCVADVAALPYADAFFDVVVSCAVLHFAPNRDEIKRMVQEMFRVLAPGGLLFARLASSIGIEDRVVALGDGRFRLPDGSDRALVTEPDLLAWTQELGASLADPIKTTNVQGMRCMTTWVLIKAAHTAS